MTTRRKQNIASMEAVFLLTQVSSLVNHYSNDKKDWVKGLFGVNSAMQRDASPANRRDMPRDVAVAYYFGSYREVSVEQLVDGRMRLAYDPDAISAPLRKALHAAYDEQVENQDPNFVFEQAGERE